MTREEARKSAEVMLAYADGKDLQIDGQDSNEWADVVIPVFNWELNSYRIKPEPTYRPFKDSNECWNEMLKHRPFGWIIREGSFQNIMAIDGAYIYMETLPTNFAFKEALAEYTFTDGTPFGIKEE